MCVLGTKLGLSAKAASAPNHQAVYTARGEERGAGARIATDAIWSWTGGTHPECQLFRRLRREGHLN